MARQITREEWLQKAVKALRPLFKKHDIVVPVVQVSCGEKMEEA